MYHVPYTPLATCLVLSGLLIYVGFGLRRQRWRPRLGTQPHCRKCDYLLVGIAAERCPECGTPTHPKNVVHGESDRSKGWIAAGSVMWGLAIFFLYRSFWWGQAVVATINWYQFHSTARIMQDLRTGTGRPVPPDANSAVARPMLGHGWVRETVDLARAALDELLRREKDGGLSEKDRNEIVELALSAVPQSWSTVTPVQYDLLDYLDGRMFAGTLTAEQTARFYGVAIDPQLTVRQVVREGDEIPVRISINRGWAAASSWTIDRTYEAVELDGRDVPLLPRLPNYAVPFLADATDARTMLCPRIGRHVLTVRVLLHVRRYGDVMYGKTLTLSAPFEVVADSPAGTIELINDPTMAEKLRACMTPIQFQYGLLKPTEIYGLIAINSAPINLAFDVFARFDGHEFPLGNFTVAAGRRGNGILPDRRQITGPLPRPPPPTIDLVLRSSPDAARATLDIFRIWDGQIVLNGVPVKNVKAK